MALEPKHSSVFEMRADDLPRDLLHASEKTLRSEVIPFGMPPRHLDQKRSVAAAEVEIQRSAPREDFIDGCLLEVIRRDPQCMRHTLEKCFVLGAGLPGHRRMLRATGRLRGRTRP